MAYSDPLLAVASAARTTTGNTAAIPLGDKGDSMCALVDVTAASGTTPSMAITVEWSDDGVTFAQGDPPDAMTALTVVSTKVKNFQVKGAFFRLVWTITGTTPSFTFSVRTYVTHM